MICGKIIFLLCVTCAVIATDESTEAADYEDVSTLPPVPANVTDRSEEEEEEETTESTTTVNPVETSGLEGSIVVHPSSAQLQTNITDNPAKLIGVWPCADNSSCTGIGNAYCREAFCHCQTAFVPHPNATHCIKVAEKIGDTCEFSRQCVDLAGYCNSGICAFEPVVTASIPLGIGTSGASSIVAASFFVLAATSLVVN